jgi:hypothetical protein
VVEEAVDRYFRGRGAFVYFLVTVFTTSKETVRQHTYLQIRSVFFPRLIDDSSRSDESDSASMDNNW